MKLYHYTTIDVLALILKNKTLRFNCLANVDDQDEAETSDYGSFKNYLFVSCWTEDSSENISLWNMYSNKMEGIRIGVDSEKIKFIPKEQKQIPVYHLVDNIKPEDKNSAFFLWHETEKYEEIDSKIRVEYDLEDKYCFEIKETNDSYLYNFRELAGKKRKEWAFQQEIRYVLFGASTENENYSNQDIFNSIREKKKFNCDFVDLLLEDQFFDGIEILTGPLITEGGKTICEALLDQYIGLNKYCLKESKFHIKRKAC